MNLSDDLKNFLNEHFIYYSFESTSELKILFLIYKGIINDDDVETLKLKLKEESILIDKIEGIPFGCVLKSTHEWIEYAKEEEERILRLKKRKPLNFSFVNFLKKNKNLPLAYNNIKPIYTILNKVLTILFYLASVFFVFKNPFDYFSIIFYLLILTKLLIFLSSLKKTNRK